MMEKVFAEFFHTVKAGRCRLKPADTRIGTELIS